MASTDRIRSDAKHIFNGDVTISDQSTFTFPMGSTRFLVCPSYNADGTVATDTEQFHIFHSAGFVKEFHVSMKTTPTTTDTVTVDLQRYNGASWATILTGAVSFSSSDANNDIKTGTLTTTSGVSVSDGHKLQVVVTVSGTSALDLTATTVCWVYPE